MINVVPALPTVAFFDLRSFSEGGSEGGSCRFWVLGPGTWILGPGYWVLGPGSWVLGSGSWVLDPGSLIFGLLSFIFYLLSFKPCPTLLQHPTSPDVVRFVGRSPKLQRRRPALPPSRPLVLLPLHR